MILCRAILRKDGKKHSDSDEGTTTESRCRKWFAHFKFDNTSFRDKPRRGWQTDYDDQAFLIAVEGNECLTTWMLADNFNPDHSTIVRLRNAVAFGLDSQSCRNWGELDGCVHKFILELHLIHAQTCKLYIETHFKFNHIFKDSFSYRLTLGTWLKSLKLLNWLD